MFKNFFNTVAQFYHILTIKKYKAKAQKLANEINCKVYAVKYKGKIKFMTREYLKELRSKNVLPKNFTAIEMSKCALFSVVPKKSSK